MIARLAALAAVAALYACSSSNHVQPDADPAPAPADPAPAPADAPPGETAEAAAAANNAFAVALYQRLRDTPDANVFFSPFSVSTALTMTSAGAAADTETQMRAALHLPDTGGHHAFSALIRQLLADRGADTQIAVANRLWGQQGSPLLEPFLATTRDRYGAGLERLNFAASDQARATINAWVSAQTRAKIPDLIPAGVLDASTRLVLTNAIYFKGLWAEAFDPDNTRAAPFHRADGTETAAQLMHREGRFAYGEDADVQVLRLPYKDAGMSMTLILPRSTAALATVEDALADRLPTWLAAPPQRKVDVFVPRFELRANTSLGPHLRALGMRDAFTGAADFSRINGAKDLYLTAVIHEAYILVDEAGTEAAAATAVVVGRKGAAPSDTPVFRADRPFLFALTDDRTGAILFMGRVGDPG